MRQPVGISVGTVLLIVHAVTPHALRARGNRIYQVYARTGTSMCAPEHARPSYRSSYEFCRVFLVVIRTPSRAGGARD